MLLSDVSELISGILIKASDELLSDTVIKLMVGTYYYNIKRQQRTVSVVKIILREIFIVRL